MNILFVCKHNRFRSKVAEAIFKKYNKRTDIKTKSAATNPDYLPVAKTVRQILKEFGVQKIDIKPRKLEKEDLSWADIIIIIANDISLDVKGKNMITWKISDTSQDDINGIKKRITEIEKRVRRLLKKI